MLRLARLSNSIIVLLKRRVSLRSYVLPLYLILICLILIVVIAIGSITLVLVLRDKRQLEAGLPSHQIFPGDHDDVFFDGCSDPQWLSPERADASLVMLARNEELDGVIKSMMSLERHFNQWFHYPWVLINDEEFTEEFKSTVRNYTASTVEFGTIPEELWEFPEDVKETPLFKQAVELQGDKGIMYGNKVSYHKMCRFFSGGFYRHPLVRKHQWYWRVEPDVEFFCDIPYDPFMEMQRRGKKYGFVIMIEEFSDTIPNLFRATRAWLRETGFEPRSSWKLFVKNMMSKVKIPDLKRQERWYANIDNFWNIASRVREVLLVEDLLRNVKKEFSSKGKSGTLMTDDDIPEDHIRELVAFAKDRGRLPGLSGERIDGQEYNLNHFWSNFEIARVDLWDNPIYESYFQFLEKQGGFYSERWGDAPVHSLAVGFMLDISEIHYFRDLGYQHSVIRHCPANHPNQTPYEASEEYLQMPGYSPKYDNFWKHLSPVKDYGQGCRCRCPKSTYDVEDNDFLQNWFEMIQEGWYDVREDINVRDIEKRTKKELRDQSKLI